MLIGAISIPFLSSVSDYTTTKIIRLRSSINTVKQIVSYK